MSEKDIATEIPEPWKTLKERTAERDLLKRKLDRAMVAIKELGGCEKCRCTGTISCHDRVAGVVQECPICKGTGLHAVAQSAIEEIEKIK